MVKTVCVILNYNDYLTTIEQIERIKNYNSIDCIVVVDNCSTDKSIDIIKKYTSEKVILIENNENKGYGAGNNVGIKVAESKKADFVIIANPDTIFEDKTIANTIEYIEKDSKCAIISPISLRPDGTLSHPIAWKSSTTMHEILTCTALFNRLIGKWNLVTDGMVRSGEEAIEVFAVPGSFFIADIRKVKISFDEDVFLYCEEKFLGKQIQEQGYVEKLYLRESYVHNHSITINKNYSDYSKKRIWLESRGKYINKYSDIRNEKKILYHMVVAIAKCECMIMGFLHNDR